MNERLKRIIFKKLDQDLGQAEIIVDDNKSIWFIDRANKFWYLELRSSGTLWWRYSFFRDFFQLFDLEREEYEPVIAEWVEEALKLGVSSFLNFDTPRNREVGRALNNKVSSSNSKELLQYEVDKVLQIKIQPEETNLKRVLSLKAGVRECKMKIKKILKKIIS